MDQYSYVANAHGNYIEELYTAYKKDPASVDYSWQKFFEGFDFSNQKYGEKGKSNGNGQAIAPASKNGVAISEKEVFVRKANLVHILPYLNIF